MHPEKGCEGEDPARSAGHQSGRITGRGEQERESAQDRRQVDRDGGEGRQATADIGRPVCPTATCAIMPSVTTSVALTVRACWAPCGVMAEFVLDQAECKPEQAEVEHGPRVDRAAGRDR